MKGNIIGEPIAQSIDTQIDLRQKLHGSGYINGTQNIQRTPEVSNYLNNRNAWIKMASGIDLSGSAAIEKLDNISSDDGEYITDQEKLNIQGSGLAENMVLFNTTQRFDTKSKSYVKRSGVRESNTLAGSIDKMYGGLGSNQRGLQPVPGITDISIECLNRGSIRKATVNIKAYNKFQFGLIELLYLRLGYMVMLEWGWDKYVSNITKSPNATTSPKINIEEMESTIIENQWFDGNSYSQSDILNLVNSNEERFQGNYGGFFGKVSNFQWKLNSDNTYDITLNLITLGSVIESLNVKVPVPALSKQDLEERKKALAKQILEEDKQSETDIADSDNIILTNVGSDALSQWVSDTIINWDAVSSKGARNKNYIFAPNLTGIVIGDKKTYMTTWKKNIPKESRFFVRFEEFLNVLQNKAIVNVINGPKTSDSELEFELDTDNVRCNYETNLVPLNANKVIFSVLIEDAIKKDIYKNSQQNQSINRGRPFNYINAQLAPFATKEGDIIFGKLLNCYLNLTFLQQSFEDSKTDKDEVLLFKFLTTICEGINESTGNVTNLEVIIKNDKTLVIIDQSSIKGGDKLIESDASNSTPIIIYGYNPKGSSNFVKDFSFQTKITPDLANMVTIGATASDDKTVNAIPFKKWNEGLVNRFGKNQKYQKSNSTDTKKEAKGSDEDFKNAFSRAIKDETAKYTNGNGYTYTYGGVIVKHIWASGISWNSDRNIDSKNSKLLATGLNKYKAALKVYNEEWEIGDPNSTLLKDQNATEGNYRIYLAKGFGGDSGYSIGSTTNPDAGNNVSKTKLKFLRENGLYFSWDNTDFINQGKNAWKNYLSRKNKLSLASTTPVISGGEFIPLELAITMDGLSGIKIFNKLEIDTKFLPSSYPKTLNFIVKGVNHKISNNTWETNVTTISVPVSVNPPSQSSTYVPPTQVATALYGSITTRYPELPLIDVPDSNLLPFKEAVETLNVITTPSIAKATFAILYSEARKSGTNFSSAGGYNYAGVQTDNARWGGGASNFISARFQRIDSGGVAREFASFNNNKEFLQFMANRIAGKGFDGLDADKWTRKYIDRWWSPADKATLNPYNDVILFGRRGKTGAQVYNTKRSFYTSAMTKYNQYRPMA